MNHHVTDHAAARAGYANPDADLSPEQVEAKKRIIIAFENFTRDVEAELDALCVVSVARDQFLMKMQEACFWAKQAVRDAGATYDEESWRIR